MAGSASLARALPVGPFPLVEDDDEPPLPLLPFLFFPFLPPPWCCEGDDGEVDGLNGICR